MKHKILIAVATGWLTTMASASEIANFLGRINTFSSQFSQTVYQDGKFIQQSSGQVKLKKPLKFRWDYYKPDPMQLISDGMYFYHYDIDLEQVTSKPVKDIAETAIASLLNNQNKLDQTFSSISLDKKMIKKRFPKQAKEWLKNADYFFELTPRETSLNDAQAKRVVLGITANHQLSLFYAEDAYGENTFIFDHIQQNTPISDGEFFFLPPAGVDIL